MAKLKNGYNYSVWIGGLEPDLYDDYNDAVFDFKRWISNDYTDAVLCRIDSDRIDENGCYQIISETNLAVHINRKEYI